MQSPGRKEAKGVQVEVRLDSAVSVPKVIILTDQMTEEVNAIVQMLSDSEPKLIAGFRDDTVTVLDEKDILRIYAANGKVFAVLPSGEYMLRLRLYEVSFDLSFTGTICVVLNDGSKTYASRRYVTRLKGVLGI